MDDPAELLRVYTFALSKALTNKNLIHYLSNRNIVVGKTASNNPISLRLFYTKQHRQLYTQALPRTV
jgi:nicotinamide mononucleotide adenylyltransferase